MQDVQVQALRNKVSDGGKIHLMVKMFDFYTTLEIDNILQTVAEPAYLSGRNKRIAF